MTNRVSYFISTVQLRNFYLGYLKKYFSLIYSWKYKISNNFYFWLIFASQKLWVDITTSDWQNKNHISNNEYSFSPQDRQDDISFITHESTKVKKHTKETNRAMEKLHLVSVLTNKANFKYTQTDSPTGEKGYSIPCWFHRHILGKHESFQSTENNNSDNFYGFNGWKANSNQEEGKWKFTKG